MKNTFKNGENRRTRNHPAQTTPHLHQQQQQPIDSLYQENLNNLQQQQAKLFAHTQLLNNFQYSSNLNSLTANRNMNAYYGTNQRRLHPPQHHHHHLDSARGNLNAASKKKLKHLLEVPREICSKPGFLNGFEGGIKVYISIKDLLKRLERKFRSYQIYIKREGMRLIGGGAALIIQNGDEHQLNDLDFALYINSQAGGSKYHANKHSLRRKTNFNDVLLCEEEVISEIIEDQVGVRFSLYEVYQLFFRESIKVSEGEESWSLFSVGSDSFGIDIKMIEANRRNYVFSIDSFEIILDPFLRSETLSVGGLLPSRSRLAAGNDAGDESNIVTKGQIATELAADRPADDVVTNKSEGESRQKTKQVEQETYGAKQKQNLQKSEEEETSEALETEEGTPAGITESLKCVALEEATSTAGHSGLEERELIQNEIEEKGEMPERESEGEEDPIEEHSNEEIVGDVWVDCGYGDFREALSHLEAKVLRTKSPKDIRRGLFRYCLEMSKHYQPLLEEKAGLEAIFVEELFKVYSSLSRLLFL